MGGPGESSSEAGSERGGSGRRLEGGAKAGCGDRENGRQTDRGAETETRDRERPGVLAQAGHVQPSLCPPRDTSFFHVPPSPSSLSFQSLISSNSCHFALLRTFVKLQVMKAQPEQVRKRRAAKSCAARAAEPLAPGAGPPEVSAWPGARAPGRRAHPHMVGTLQAPA